MSEQTVEKPYELFSFIDYMKSGTQLNNEREVFVANAARAQGVSSQQARIRELEASRQANRDTMTEAVKKVVALEAELEARKKAWEELDSWLNICGADTGGGECDGMVNPESVQIKMTALEATLPKGGA